MKNPFNIPNGTVIKGKWHLQSYTIVKELGRGANGVVYLADWNKKRVAIKVSDNNVTITSEMNVLKSFSKAQGVTLGPSLLDVDDWVLGNKTIPFYVMEFIEGVHFLAFIQQKGKSWVDIFILQLLADLEKLHEQGWVFGDLKPDNLIVTGPPIKIRCIDVGGVTLQGRAIKEFTEFYDRGYWGLGSRKAEPSFDLFAVAMIMINTYYPQRFPKQQDGLSLLRQKIEAIPELRKHEQVLLRALTGKYATAIQMREDLLDSISKSSLRNQSRALKQKTTVSPTPNKKRTVKQIQPSTKKRPRKHSGIKETIIIFMVVCFLYVLYIYQQI
ncbi:protein kinase domain-containing protein [Perspicuibacillus lycopersici]|nr:protein kinase [Perspicuibacillus lycopersici]